jgi:hypothetical protein
VVFGLNGVPVGLTGAQAAENVRPYLQEQNARLSDLLLADFETDSDSVDFYYCRASDGATYLFFVGETDMKDQAPYLYQHPGFFGTSTLEDKLSSTQIPGLSDTRHEKLPIVAGETIVHFEDDLGIVRRARIVRDAGSDDIEITLGGGRQVGADRERSKPPSERSARTSAAGKSSALREILGASPNEHRRPRAG